MNLTIPKINQIVDPQLPASIPVPVSKDELCAFSDKLKEMPTQLGKIQEDLDSLYGKSFIYYLLSQGHEMYRSGHSVSLKEEIDTLGTTYEFPNLISRKGNVFTINKNVLEDEMKEAGDVCLPDLTKLTFRAIATQEITVSDGEIQENGFVKEISNDGLSMTAVPSNGNAWTIAESDLDIIVMSTDMSWDDCGTASCYNPVSMLFGNIFRRSVNTCQFKEGELLNNGNTILYENGIYYYDRRMDKLKLDHWNEIGQTIMFGKKAEKGSGAEALGLGNMKSIKDQLLEPYGALKVDGYLETRDDMSQLVDYMRKYRSPNIITIRADSAQYSKLQKMSTDGMVLTYDPFDTKEKMARFSFSGIEIEGYQFYFTVCDLLATGGFAGRKFKKTTPNFIMIPEGKVTIQNPNDKKEEIGYVNIIWNKSNQATYRAFKRVDPKHGCPYSETKYESSYTPVVAKRQNCIIGV